ncbi:hypothetical protein MNBD_DELTA01-468 [hydrothermal vent metagenome]|uniref:Carboxymuconolactone decarboxylase-like domain-containing protein n=1 Tax=hydrothermal vent metagenome TaxID=652676 RepID=A0A3B0QRG9_9ZZZZ
MNNEKKREEIFAKVKEKYGFVPNIIKELALSPVVAEAYITAVKVLEGTSFTKQEIQAINLATSTQEGSDYCKTGHTAMGKAAGLDSSDLELIRAGKDPVDERLKALVCATRAVNKKRGRLETDDLKCLESKGITRGEIYEIIAVVASKIIPTYVNHIADVEIDQELLDGACCSGTDSAPETSASCCS